ncbi:MAG: hypothetical protein ACI8RZ_002543 [Myxococcota bacterium]|jgi:hypothetical protein
MLPLLFLSPAMAFDVLIIYDTTAEDTPDLVKALEGAGLSVTLSDDPEYDYDGTNPAPDAFNAVIHLNGSSYATSMSDAGQLALANYVYSGGGFISTEWNAYAQHFNYMTNMNELILLDRVGGYEGSLEYEIVKAKSSHPVLNSIPSSFTFTGGTNTGPAASFKSDPAEVLMMDGDGNDAVVVREHNLGRIVSFSHAANYGSYGTLANSDIQQLFINAVEWAASCDIDGDGYDSDRGSCGGLDCDDSEATTNPDAVEVCDSIDNDCDGAADGPDSIDVVTFYADADGDGYGDAGTASADCEIPSGAVLDDTDCDDGAGDVFPGATETAYDSIDQDCDGSDLCDVDGDGGEAGECGGTDCDDADATINADAEEVYYDGVDADCDGESDFDADADGEDAVAGGGTDCDDADAAINTAAEDIADDGIDQDCDGIDAVTSEDEVITDGQDDKSCATATPSGALGMLAGLAMMIGLRRRE